MAPPLRQRGASDWSRAQAVTQPEGRGRAFQAIVAVARQLAIDLWRIRTGRVRAEELGFI